MAEQMRLSEAIREGAKLRPQAFGYYVDSSGSCSIGAAAEGIAGYNPSGQVCAILSAAGHWPTLKAPSHCPEKDCEIRPDANVEAVCLHLNDDHRWSRERIAEWLEQQGY